MADSKEYGYYIEGNKIAIVQRDTSFDNDANSRDYGPGSDKFQWKSPLESVDKGIEFQYSYSPEYKEINKASRVVRGADGLYSYKSTGNTGKLVLVTDNGADFSSSIGSYILLINAGRWNGIHYIATGSGSNTIVTDTNYSDGSATTAILFESNVTYNLNISVMLDESYEVDHPNYLQKALVSYLKSRLFEDMGELKMKEYYYKDFIRQLEKHNNSKVPGVRMVAPGINAIK